MTFPQKLHMFFILAITHKNLVIIKNPKVGQFGRDITGPW